MADYGQAFKRTILGNEGGYNPGLGENETYMGIDRGMNPKWNGWQVIDNIKAANRSITTARLNMLLATNAQLQANIQAFYKSGYWDTLSLDKIGDQQLANNLFDCSVNPCIESAGMVFQKACNAVISANNLVIHPLHVDGNIGPLSITVANELNPCLLFNAINAIRLAHYEHEVVIRPSKAEWLPVWKKRLISYQA